MRNQSAWRPDEHGPIVAGFTVGAQCGTDAALLKGLAEMLGPELHARRG
jgi:hypothetical protein